MHNGDRRGFHTLRTVVERLRQRDPAGTRTRWRTCGEITTYACARELADLTVDGRQVTLAVPLAVPELTLRLRGIQPGSITAGGMTLRQVRSREDFTTGTFYGEGDETLLAFDPPAGERQVTIAVQAA